MRAKAGGILRAHKTTGDLVGDGEVVGYLSDPFGETDVDKILAEAAACHRAHPNNHVRLVGFDNYAQSKGAEMVVYRGIPV